MTLEPCRASDSARSSCLLAVWAIGTSRTPHLLLYDCMTVSAEEEIGNRLPGPGGSQEGAQRLPDQNPLSVASWRSLQRNRICRSEILHPPASWL